MANRVRWVKGGNPDASDAAPTLARSPVTWERASKVLTMEQPDADDTNPVPAVVRRRAVEGTEEVDALDIVIEEAPPAPRKVSVAATCEIQADDVLEEVTVPKNQRDAAQRDRKTDPPSWRDRKTDPPSRRAVAHGVPVPHWTDGGDVQIPAPAPVPSTRPWVTDARHEQTALHDRPPPKSRTPWMIVGGAAGAALTLAAVILLAPDTSSAGVIARVPTLHHVTAKHSAERIGHGPKVPVYDLGALPR